jgi:hypothetical protein
MPSDTLPVDRIETLIDKKSNPPSSLYTYISLKAIEWAASRQVDPVRRTSCPISVGKVSWIIVQQCQYVGKDHHQASESDLPGASHSGAFNTRLGYEYRVRRNPSRPKLNELIPERI